MLCFEHRVAALSTQLKLAHTPASRLPHMPCVSPHASTCLDARQHPLAQQALREGRAIRRRLEQRLFEQDGPADARLANGRGVEELSVCPPVLLSEQ